MAAQQTCTRRSVVPCTPKPSKAARIGSTSCGTSAGVRHMLPARRLPSILGRILWARCVMRVRAARCPGLQPGCPISSGSQGVREGAGQRANSEGYDDGTSRTTPRFTEPPVGSGYLPLRSQTGALGLASFFDQHSGTLAKPKLAGLLEVRGGWQGLLVHQNRM